MDWIIYYGDDTEYTSDQGPPETAPTHNVIVVSTKNSETGRADLHKHNHYIYKDGLDWIGVDFYGALDLHQNDPNREVHGWVSGRTIPSVKFNSILKKARSDLRLPSRSAYNKQENGTYGRNGAGKDA